MLKNHTAGSCDGWWLLGRAKRLVEKRKVSPKIGRDWLPSVWAKTGNQTIPLEKERDPPQAASPIRRVGYHILRRPALQLYFGRITKELSGELAEMQVTAR